MFDTEDLGRYEFHGTTDKGNSSYKFWHVVHDLGKDEYIATWGRIGKRTFGTKIYSREQILKKVKEKTRKGYNKVAGYDETVGMSSIHFITKICAG